MSPIQGEMGGAGGLRSDSKSGDHSLVPAATARLFEEGEPPELTLLDYLGLAIKWRWLLAGAAVLGAAAGLVVTILTTPLYKATATVEIDHEPAKIVAVQSQEVPDYADSRDYYQTQYALLRGRSLAQRVVSDQDLADDASFLRLSKRGSAGAQTTAVLTDVQRHLREKRAMRLIVAGLHVDPVRESRLVNISFDAPDPVIAAKIANAVASSFITVNLEHRYEASDYARRFLEDRLAQTRIKLQDSERQLVAYAAQNQIVSLNADEQNAGAAAPPQASLQATDLAAVDQALAAATTARIQAEQRWRQADRTTDLTTLPEVQADPTIQAALSARAVDEAGYRQNRSIMKPDHPTMLALQARIAQESMEILARAAAIRQALRIQYDVARSQEEALKAEVNFDKNEVLNLRDRSIEYNILQREVDTNKTLYDGLLQRYKEIGVTGGVGTNNISVVESAQVPGVPFKPALSRNLGIFTAVALALGGLIAWLLERLDLSIKAPDEVEAKLGLALLGAIPKIPKRLPMGGVMADPRSVISEAYSSVRTALSLSTPDGVPQWLLITSARAGEGKSTTALVLARSFARVGLKVLLVDGDMRDPALHRLFGADNGVGFSNVLSGGVGPQDALQATDQENLSLMACGPRPPNPAELLTGENLRTFLDWARDGGYMVIIDGPPVLALADVPLLAQAMEGTLIVVEAGVTKRDLARAAIHRLRMVRARIIGVVLTKFDAKEAGYSYRHAYGYGYGVGYGYAYQYGARPVQSGRPLGMPVRARWRPWRRAS